MIYSLTHEKSVFQIVKISHMYSFTTKSSCILNIAENKRISKSQSHTIIASYITSPGNRSTKMTGLILLTKRSTQRFFDKVH